MLRTPPVFALITAVTSSLLMACSGGGDGVDTTSAGSGAGGSTSASSANSSSSQTAVAASSGAGGGSSFVCDPPADPGSIYEFSAESFDINQIEPVSMCKYRGDVMLIVNTAAKCGYSPQYAPLEALETQHKAAGLHVLGFLSNDFLNQGGTDAEIEACNQQYGVTFEQFSIIHVKKGANQHPLFQWLTSQQAFLDASASDDVAWNFNKWLVARDGTVVGYWNQDVNPADPTPIPAAIEAELAK
jgi:glutathione peroxidase